MLAAIWVIMLHRGDSPFVQLPRDWWEKEEETEAESGEVDRW